MGVFLLFALLLLSPRLVWAQACTHYASATGSGSACTIGSPCLINSFWALATAGHVLCLNDGTYTGANSMITPPAGVKGASGNPLTVRALNDGAVLIDAQNARTGMQLSWHGGPPNSNDYMVVEGINFTNGLSSLLYIGSQFSLGKRLIGWNGTSGDPGGDSNIFRSVGYNSRFEDCAGWGMNSRKIFDGAQENDLQTAGFKRCWGEWNDWPGGVKWPINTYQVGYGSWNQLWENVLGTVRVLGDLSPADHEGVSRFQHARTSPPLSYDGSRLLGAIFYTTPGVTIQGHSVAVGGDFADFLVEDSAFIVDPGRPTIYPYYDFGCSISGTCTNNVCQNCLMVHAGQPALFQSGGFGGGWTTPSLHQGNGLAAATGGTSAFVLLPGICNRYENGTLTSTPLWPWPMNQRILDARAAGGFPSVDVTATIESILGTIPAECRTGASGSPELTVTPGTVMRGSSVTAAWSGIVAPSPFDWIGLYVPSSANAAYLAYQYLDPSHASSAASGSLTFAIPPAPLAAGTYELRLFNEDMLTNLLDISNTFTVTEGIGLLGEVTSLDLTGNTTPAFLGDVTGLDLTASSAATPLGEVTALDMTGAATPVFLGDVTGLNVTQP